MLKNLLPIILLFFCLSSFGQDSQASAENASFNGLENTEFDLNMYPNPVMDKLNFEISDGHSIIETQIVNIVGETIRTQSIDPSETNIELTVTSLPEGLYFVRLIDASGVPINLETFVKK